MGDFIFSFGFCTPEQRLTNDENGWDDESSASIGIRGASADQVKKWGCEVAEAFCQHLYRRSSRWVGEPPKWKSEKFAFWVSEPDVAGNQLPRVWVAVGEMPDLNEL